jgi:hypothetical protein
MGVFSFLFRGGKTESTDDLEEAAIREAIERLVEETDPRIRLIRRYAEKLRPGVETALRHNRGIVARIPGPIPLDARSWSEDPLVNAVFARADDIPGVVSRSVEVREFFERGAGKGSQECFALFGTQRAERRILGKELMGEIVQSDVVQTAVSFTNYRVIAPAATEAELRRQIEQRAFHHLVEEAIDRVSQAFAREKGLEEQRALLRLKVKVMRQQHRGLESLIEAESQTSQDGQELQRELAEVETRLRQLHVTLSNLENYVPHLNKLLGHPEEHLSLQEIPLRLNRMNIVVGKATGEPVHDLRLAEVKLRDGRSFALLLVKCRRDDLRPQRELWEEAARRL